MNNLDANKIKQKIELAFNEEINSSKLTLIHWANYAERLEDILNEIIDEIELLEKIK